MFERRITVTTKLILNFFLLSMIPLLVIDTVFYMKSREALSARIFDQLTFVRAEKVNRIHDFMKQRLNDLENLARHPEVMADISADSSGSVYLFSDHPAEGEEALLSYLRSTGVYMGVVRKREGTEAGHHEKYHLDWWYKGMDMAMDGVYMGEGYFAGNKEMPVVIWAKEAVSDNDPRSLVALISPLSLLSEIMYEDNPAGLGSTGEAYIVGGDHIMRSTSRFRDSAIMNIVVATPGVEKALTGLEGTGTFNDYRGVKVLSSFSPMKIAGLNWVILAEMDAEEAMVPIQVLRNSLIYLTIIIGLLLLGIVIFNANWIMLPVRRLKEAADSIIGGKYGMVIPKGQNDELGDLINSFNLMSETLREQSEEIDREKLVRTTAMIDAQEAERQHLGRDLHDGLGQQLLAIRMKVEQLALHADPQHRQQTGEVSQLIQNSIDEIRNISSHLMPSVLSQFGLVPAIIRLIRQTEATASFVVHMEVDQENIPELVEREQLYLFRIMQEALSNMVKHARATEVRVRLSNDHRQLLLEVSDNGIGFNPDKGMMVRGNGLSHMKERINLLGGSFDLISAPGQGTTLRFVLPL